LVRGQEIDFTEANRACFLKDFGRWGGDKKSEKRNIKENEFISRGDEQKPVYHSVLKNPEKGENVAERERLIGP